MNKYAAIILFLLSLSCSGTEVFAGNKQEKSGVTQDAAVFAKFIFFSSFQFCGNPNAPLTLEQANRIYREKEIAFDPGKERKAPDWSAFFYEGSQQCAEEMLGEKHDTSYLFSTSDSFPFEEVVLLNGKYLLVAQDGFFFVFKEYKKDGAARGESSINGELDRNVLKQIVEALETRDKISLTIEYSYDFINELKGFISIDNAPGITELDYLAELQFAKLPLSGKTRLLLVLGYRESGQSELHLITLNDSFSIIDKIKLYDFQEIEGGGILTKFKISKDMKILIVKEETVGSRAIILEEKLFHVDLDGHIVHSE